MVIREKGNPIANYLRKGIHVDVSNVTLDNNLTFLTIEQLIESFDPEMDDEP